LLKKFIHKILCFFGIHSYNIAFLTAVVHLECKYCTAGRISTKSEMYKKADIQYDIYKKESLLKRQVLIEKRSSFSIKIEELAKKQRLRK